MRVSYNDYKLYLSILESVSKQLNRAIKSEVSSNPQEDIPDHDFDGKALLVFVLLCANHRHHCCRRRRRRRRHLRLSLLLENRAIILIWVKLYIACSFLKKTVIPMCIWDGNVFKIRSASLNIYSFWHCLRRQALHETMSSLFYFLFDTKSMHFLAHHASSITFW